MSINHFQHSATSTQSGTEKYSDFISRNSTENGYSPTIAAGSLIRAISNDMMALLICSLQRDRTFTITGAHKRMHTFLRNKHVAPDAMKIGEAATRNFFDAGGRKSDPGLLVELGIVSETSELNENGAPLFALTEAGGDLFRPIAQRAVVFVHACMGKGYRFDSMASLFGERKRSYHILRMIKHMMENGPVSRNEIMDVLGDTGKSNVISTVSHMKNVGLLEDDTRPEGKGMLKPTEFARMLYRIVLEPAIELAESLNPDALAYIPVKRGMLRRFVNNYETESRDRGRRTKPSPFKQKVVEIVGAAGPEGIKRSKILSEMGHPSYLEIALTKLVREKKIGRLKKGTYVAISCPSTPRALLRSRSDEPAAADAQPQPQTLQPQILAA